MKIIYIIVFFFLLLLIGCAHSPVSTILGGKYILLQEGKKEAVISYSIWRKEKDGKQLVCRFVVEKDKIVSILPTPVSSDAVRETANFIRFGNGYSPIFQLYLDEKGNLFRTERGVARLNEKNEAIKHSELWNKQELSPQMQKLLFDEFSGYVYIVIQQNASFSRVNKLLKEVASNEAILFGVGWDPSGF